MLAQDADALVDGLREARQGRAVPLQGEPNELGPGVVQELFGKLSYSFSQL